MWIEKLSRGVLELETPIGPRYINPNLLERARLMWTFRNFSSLPHQVLRSSELRLIDRLSIANRFVSRAIEERPVIGKVEGIAEAIVEGRSEGSAEKRVEPRAIVASEDAPLRKPPMSVIAASRQNAA
ncbi:MAG: hypothetical protein WAL41_05595 [Mycobacterium sp.]